MPTEVPPGWEPETYYRHLQNLEWMKAMDCHFSFTDPKRIVQIFKEKVIREFAKNANIARISLEDLPAGSVLEREILEKIDTVDLSNADLVVLWSASATVEGVDQLVVAQLSKILREKRGRDGIVLVLRPEEGLETLDMGKIRALADRLNARILENELREE